MSVNSDSMAAETAGGTVAGLRPWTVASMLGLLLGATLVFGMVRTTTAGQRAPGNWVRSEAAAVVQGSRMSAVAAIRAIDGKHGTPPMAIE